MGGGRRYIFMCVCMCVCYAAFLAILRFSSIKTVSSFKYSCILIYDYVILPFNTSHAPLCVYRLKENSLLSLYIWCFADV
jgi:hypothetical protein